MVSIIIIIMIIIIIAAASVPENDIHETPMGLWHTNELPNLGQKIRPYNNQKKKKKKREFAKLWTLLSQFTTE